MLNFWLQSVKDTQIFRKLALVLSVIMIGGVLGVGIAHAAYTHTLLKPWGNDYQTCTYQVQSTFGSLTKTQFADAMIHWNGQLTKNFLFKSSTETNETKPSKDGIRTVTKYNYGKTTWVAQNHLYYNFWKTYFVESDIEFNTYWKFANSGNYSDSIDIQSVMLHELGHTLCVGHSTQIADVMWPDSFYGVERRVTTAADREAARDSTARWFSN